jgi:predicted metal-dependent hydrolase
MTDLVVRRLLIDLAKPIPARWNGGDAFRSAYFNALSMSFPVGEQFFIDSLRAGIKTLPDDERARLAPEVQGFIGQEATHRRIHELFNGHLERLGYINTFGPRAARRIKAKAHRHVSLQVATTAAIEHLTAINADWLLRHPEALEGAAARFKTMWQWHAAEELEHRCTAFDLYTAMNGSHKWRIRTFLYMTVTFQCDVLRQTVRNLWHDGSLFKWSTLRSGAQLLLAKDGMLRDTGKQWRDYLAKDFHPSQHDGQLSEQWLRENSAQFSLVAQAR